MSDPAPDGQGVGKWVLGFLGTGGGAAIVTAAIASLLGPCAAAQIQRSARERDFQASWMKAHAEQSLAARRQYLERSVTTIDTVYASIGVVTSACDNLILVVQPNWGGRQDSVARAFIIKEVRAAYVKATDTWHNDKARYGLYLDYYYGAEDDSVLNAWRRLQTALDAYAYKAYEMFVGGRPLWLSSTNSVPVLRTAVYTALDDLTASTRNKRRYVWQGWESPETLQVRLGLR